MRDENVKKSLSFLEQFFVSFGIGLSIYVSISYFLDIFKLFNFFTAYLSIIIFDSLFLVYFFNKNHDELMVKYNKDFLKERLKQFLSVKNNLIQLCALIFTIIFIFIIQWVIITEATSLNYTDPYKWYQATFYLLDNGHIDYTHLDYNYPSGHAFFNAGVLLIYPDYLFGYYYFKLIPIYFILFYVIIAFVIVRKLFKSNYLIILSLLFILTSRYFISRTLLYLSSSLASALLIISLIILINKYPDYVMGFFIAGLYLIHNLTTFYFIFVLLSYYLIRFLLKAKKLEIVLEQIFSIIFLIGITIVLLIPYLLGIYLIYNDSLIDFVAHFFERFSKADYAYLIKYSRYHDEGLINLVYPLDYFKSFIKIDLLELIDELLKRSIYLFFIFTILGLIIYLNPKKNVKDIETLIFFKLFIIVIILFFFLPYFFDSLNFFIKFRKRILQSFSLPIIIMALYSIEWIVNLSKNFTKFLAFKLKFYENLIHTNKFYSKLFRIESIIIIFLTASLSSSVLTHRFPDYYYYYEDELVEVVLYLRTHAEPNSKILRKDYDTTPIFRMLYDMKVKEWDLNKSSTYDDLLLEIDERDIDYLIFPKDYFHNGSIDNLITKEDDFKELVDNDEYFLFKIKN